MKIGRPDFLIQVLAYGDIALSVYDSSDGSLRKRAAELHVGVASQGGNANYEMPCLIIAAIDDLDPYPHGNCMLGPLLRTSNCMAALGMPILVATSHFPLFLSSSPFLVFEITFFFSFFKSHSSINAPDFRFSLLNNFDSLTFQIIFTLQVLHP